MQLTENAMAISTIEVRAITAHERAISIMQELWKPSEDAILPSDWRYPIVMAASEICDDCSAILASLGYET